LKRIFAIFENSVGLKKATEECKTVMGKNAFAVIAHRSNARRKNASVNRHSGTSFEI